MADGLPGLPPPGFASAGGSNGRAGLPPPGFADDPTFMGDIPAIAGGAAKGTADLLGLIESGINSNPITMGTNYLYDLIRGEERPPQPKIADYFLEGSKMLGADPDAQAQTAMGKLARGVAYQAPGMLIPGGGLLARGVSTGLAGLSGGAADILGFGETGQGVASAIGGIGPAAVAAGTSKAYKGARNLYDTVIKQSPEKVIMEALEASGAPANAPQGIVKKLAEAKAQGTPMTFLEAANEPAVESAMLDYAQTPRGSRMVAKSIDRRTAGETDRLAKAIEGVAPQKEIMAASGSLKEVASETLKKLKARRSELAAPLYKEAHEKTPYIGEIKTTKEMGGPKGITGVVSKQRVVPSENYKNLLETKEVKHVINKANRTLTEGETPELYSSKRAQTILAGLNDEISRAKRSQNAEETGLLVKLKKKLEAEIGKYNPELMQAQKAYAKMSQQIDGVSETLIGALDDIADNKLRTAGSTIFGPNVKPSEIENLRAQMGEGAGALRDFAGSYLNDLMKKGDVKAIHKFVSSTANQEKLAAAIGDKEAADVFISIIKNENSLEKMKSVAKAVTGKAEKPQDFIEKTGSVVMKTTSPFSPVGRAARYAYKTFAPKQDIKTTMGVAKALSRPDAALRTAQNVAEQYPEFLRSRAAGPQFGGSLGVMPHVPRNIAQMLARQQSTGE